MNQRCLGLHPYCRSVGSAAANATRRWRERNGLFVELRFNSRLKGWGEASPLPGYSPDDLGGARAALGGLTLNDLGIRDLLDAVKLDAIREAVRATIQQIPETQPAARFALESALFDLLGRHRGQPLPALLASDSGADWGPIAVADLSTDLLSEADSPAAEPDRKNDVLKVKVGREGAFPEELTALTRLRELRPDVELRLDANGAWSVDQALGYLDRLVRLGIRWIEEPARVGSVDELSKLMARAALPIALDESLWQLSLSPATVAQLQPAALVLKPQVLGGNLRCLDVATAGYSTNTVAIASHTFDGPIAYRATQALALVLDRGQSQIGHHGLAAHDGLRAWPEGLAEVTCPPTCGAAGSGLLWEPPMSRTQDLG